MRHTLFCIYFWVKSQGKSVLLDRTAHVNMFRSKWLPLLVNGDYSSEKMADRELQWDINHVTSITSISIRLISLIINILTYKVTHQIETVFNQELSLNSSSWMILLMWATNQLNKSYPSIDARVNQFYHFK